MRFLTFFLCRRLNHFLRDQSKCGASQILDQGTIKRIIQNDRRDLDLGMYVSRRAFCQAMGIESVSNVRITRIIYVEYSCNKMALLQEITIRDAIDLLLQNELHKESLWGKIERQREITPPRASLLRSEWFEGVKCYRLAYSGWESLCEKTLGAILA